MILCRFIGLLIVFATWLVPASAQAAKARKPPPPSSAYQNKPIPDGATVWYCAYNGDTTVVCRLGDVGDETVARPVHVVDSRLPRLVHEIRNNPEQLADTRISIPLYTEPYDFDLVGELAESVMCGGQAICGVIFAETGRALAQMVSVFENTRLAINAARLMATNTPPAHHEDQATPAFAGLGQGAPAYQFASAE